MPFGAEERLWYLGLVLSALTWFTARGLLRGRPGRAPGGAARQRDRGVRDGRARGPVPLGRVRRLLDVRGPGRGPPRALLPPRRARLLLLLLSVDYLATIVIGGLGSVAGATAGAVFVTALPLLMTRYADQLPLVATPGSGDGSIGPTEASRYLYGAAIVVILLYAPDGLHGLARRTRARLRRKSPDAGPTSRPPATTANAARTKEHTP